MEWLLEWLKINHRPALKLKWQEKLQELIERTVKDRPTNACVMLQNSDYIRKPQI